MYYTLRALPLRQGEQGSGYLGPVDWRHRLWCREIRWHVLWCRHEFRLLQDGRLRYQQVPLTVEFGHSRLNLHPVHLLVRGRSLLPSWLFRWWSDRLEWWKLQALQQHVGFPKCLMMQRRGEFLGYVQVAQILEGLYLKLKLGTGI